MSFWKKFINFITPPSKEIKKVTKTKVTSTSGPMTNVITNKAPVVKAKRARTKKGKFIADDKSTPNVNEAYTTKRVKKKVVKPTRITTDNIGD